jgi:hypothetical protein
MRHSTPTSLRLSPTAMSGDAAAESDETTKA